MVFKRKCKGSVTVFFSMIIVMVISLVLSLVELLHYIGLERLTVPVSKIGAESAFADYNRALLEDYGILAIDGGYGKRSLDIARMEERVLPYLCDNINPEGKLNFLRAYPSVEVLDYGVLTDQGGAAFIKEAAITMMYELPADIINPWRDLTSDIESNDSDNEGVEELLLKSKESMDSADVETEGEEVILSTLTPDKQYQFEQNGSPIDAILKFKSKAILAQVVRDMSLVSPKEMDPDVPSKRESVSWGSTGSSITINTRDRAMFLLYLKKHFGSYKNPKEQGGLSYEWEYVIGGKNSDIRNLEVVVTRLLALRESQNLISIMQDQTKVTEAYSIATAICAGLAIPALIEPVKLGVIAAWAYLESVLDVRLLLNGGKVAPVKTPAQWTSNILLFPNYIRTDVCAYDSDTGMDYEDYLMVITLLVRDGLLGLRSLDITEIGLRAIDDYANVHMENFIYRADFLFTYHANPMFASLTPMLSGRLKNYEIKKTESLSYI